jgi:hypothetical protein
VEGKMVAIPEKLRNKFTGPYRMIRWAGDRYCVIDMNGKEVMHNVNRLIKHHAWDDVHPHTDAPPGEKLAAAPERTPTPTEGSLIVFPTTYNDEHKCFFGVGRVIEVRGPNNIFFQWLGNKPLSEASKAFAPGWVDPRDNKGYYAKNPLHPSHPPWTNKDTATNLAVSAIIAQGDILAASGKISTAIRGTIESAVGETITWGLP